ncbi:MAG: hypothetical protein KatS3mg105_2495 [Gemmatales bacterium]|nr:MAG: hypothetical protein KatS3mg105_2495 [Gemmatales bacterium]
MKAVIKRFSRSSVERLLLWLASPIAAAFDRFITGNAAYGAFSRHGFHLLRKHYYLPIPDKEDLNDRSQREPAELVGIDMNDAAALNLLHGMVAEANIEFRRLFPLHATDDPSHFFLINGGFMAGDAHVYWAFLRRLKPKRVIEIGAGNSTVLAAHACRLNAAEGTPTRLIAIEPYPSQALKKGISGLDCLIEKRVQDVDLSVFLELEAGDILFIDSSHVLRPGGDVQREYCEILPRLPEGVFVHIHDISLPKPYFSVYFQNHLYWNEQYLLQAFLTFNDRYEVVWPGTYLLHRYPDEMHAAFPEIAEMRKTYPLAEPSSFWIRRKRECEIANRQ